MFVMPSILSRPAPPIGSPAGRPTSKQHADYDSPILERGCTARNSSGKKKKRKIVLVNNSYHDAIIARVDEIKKEERTGKNCLITIGNLKNAAEALLCKECVSEEIEGERKRCVEIISSHLSKQKSGFQSKEGYITEFTALLKKCKQAHQFYPARLRSSN